MENDFISAATGFAQQTPTGWVFEIGNGWLTRRIQMIGGRIGTTSLLHNLNAEEYLEETVEEFALEVSKGELRRKMSFTEFAYVSHKMVENESVCSVAIMLEGTLDGVKIPVTVAYDAVSGQNWIGKSVVVHPSESDWMLEYVTLEHLRLKEMVEGIAPLSRYPTRFGNGEDDVHTDPDQTSIESPKSRFEFGDRSRAVLTYWGFNEGLFFFMGGELGEESFERGTGLVMRQKAYAPLRNTPDGSLAIIGAYAGQPEFGFKRYTEFLSKRCVIEEKVTPVEWNSWFVTRGRTPVLTDCDRTLILDELPHICEAGSYDVLHLDLGWEARLPITPDPVKFPNGLSEIVRRASECGLDMGYWINPFSSNYWRSDVEEEHPEWLNPAKVSGQSGAHAICPMTGYFDFVGERLKELVTTFNARLIFWDGGDWNIPYCTGSGHDHSSQHELEVRAMERLAELVASLREARPDLFIAAFNLPFDNHKLHLLDQQQVSDTYSFPTGQAELIQRQQMYQMTWEHPYKAIRSSWHGVDWHEASDTELKARSLGELFFAEMSMLGCGANQAGGSIDLAGAPKPLVEFLKKMLAWRKRFEKYFTVYQHILGFPDGVNVDGEAHIIDGKGFLILINPADEAQTIPLPLDEPDLELPTGTKFRLYDWSDFENGRFLGQAKAGDRFEVDLAEREVRVIGVEVRE